jgi:capsid protein
MRFLGLNIEFARAKKEEVKETYLDQRMNAAYNNHLIHLGSVALPYDGEKSIGQMGPATSYIPNYYLLSTRSWQAYTDNPLAKTGTKKWVDWVLDTGLKLKTNPAKIVLESEGVAMDKKASERFNDIVESRWEVWSNSKFSSFTGEETFNEVSKQVYINAKIGGDCLVVLRLINGLVRVQYFDGQRICNPTNEGPILADGSIISNGVKVSATGKVLGYYLRKDNLLETEFIPAYSEATKLRTAFLVKGSQWRINYHRGMPVVATVLETLLKIDRYREASVGSAEEVAKIAFQVVHQNYSDGSSPLQETLAKAINGGNGQGDDMGTDAAGNVFADKVAVTTNKQVFNNPKGAELKPVNQSTAVSGFTEFYEPNANIIFACIGIPPNVAMSIYNDSFSASRAATKDWDHTMDIERNDFTNQYFHYVYKFWLYSEMIQNKIPAQGYLKAFFEGNIMITEAYERMRFTGPHFPHIDPVKEVKAEREKLGELGKMIPLTTVELATEALGGGDSDSNMEQFADEMQIADNLGIKPKDPVIVEPKENG